jgi:hypothetical protein
MEAQITQKYNEKEVQEEGNWISVVKRKMQWTNVEEESTDNLNAVRSSLILQKETGSSAERERNGDMKNARHTK